VKVLAKRSRTEQKLAVLDACMVPLKVTTLMYRTNMNCVVLKEFAEELVGKGLLTKTVIGKRAFFRTSASGYAVLSQWRQIEASLGA